MDDVERGAGEVAGGLANRRRRREATERGTRVGDLRREALRGIDDARDEVVQRIDRAHVVDRDALAARGERRLQGGRGASEQADDQQRDLEVAGQRLEDDARAHREAVAGLGRQDGRDEQEPPARGHASAAGPPPSTCEAW